MPDPSKCSGQEESSSKQNTHVKGDKRIRDETSSEEERPTQRTRVHSSGPVPESQNTIPKDENEMPFYQDFDETVSYCFMEW